jgi:type II secretory pathway predicted ATPase ExeA
MSDRVGTEPDWSFRVEGQERALAQVMAGMDEGGRWVLVLGRDGIGKSTVLRRLRAELELTDADTVVCEGSEALGADGLVSMLRTQLRLAARPEPRSLWGSRPLQTVLANQRARGKPLVLLVDDAHLLPRPSLALLAELAAKPSATDPAVFVVLSGRPALEQPALRAWDAAGGGAGTVTCRLAALTAAEAQQYVERRMNPGPGGSPGLPDAAVERIVGHTGGVPGLIDALCDQVMAHPSSRLTERVSGDTVDEAARHLGLGASPRAAPWGPMQADLVDAQEDARPRGRRASGRVWRWAGALTAGTLVACLLVYLGPDLLRASLDWVGTGPEATRSIRGLAGPAPPRQEGPRPDASSPGRAPGPSGGARAVRSAMEQRAATPVRAEQASRPPVSAPRPAAARPSPQQVAALLAGARDGRLADLDRLLASGVPANVADAAGFTPLMLAVVNGHLPAARALLDRGALVNARDRGGITPLMLGVINARPEVLKLLLDRGADVNAQSGTGWTALTFAAWKGEAELVRVLLDHGANAAALDKQRWTPLDYAAERARTRSPRTEGTEPDAAVPDSPERAEHPAPASPSGPSGAR